MSRVLGVLYASGGLLVLLSLLLPHPEEASATGLAAIVGVGFTVGIVSIVWARHARLWTVHAVLAAGTVCISLSVYFSGVATGVYSAMFIWVVLVAASFFSGRAVAAQMVFILVAWGIALLGVADSSSGFPAVTQWVLGSLVLVVASTVMTEIVAGRRSTQARLRKEIAEKAHLQRELEHLAHHDPLTGLANRRRFEEELDRELARAARSGTPLCVIALDLDDFKRYNDVHGHIAGDLVLKSVASRWAGALREGDLMARVGGDEFVALLPDCPASEAEGVADRLCHASFAQRGTCSAGSAQWDGRESADEFLSRADRAMYEAKVSRGRGAA